MLQRATLAGLCCAAGLICRVATGQDFVPPAKVAPPATASVEDRIVVRRRRPAQLRAEIERAEDAFYARFNAINSDDSFDIVCRQERITGSKMPRRVCMPEYERAALEGAAKDQLNGLHGNGSTGSGEFAGRAHYTHQELEAEMRKLAAEDAQLRDALTRLVTLQQTYEAATGKPRDGK